MGKAHANLQKKPVAEPQPAPYKPDETRRLEQARQWLAVARGRAQEPNQ